MMSGCPNDIDDNVWDKLTRGILTTCNLFSWRFALSHFSSNSLLSSEPTALDSYSRLYLASPAWRVSSAFRKTRRSSLSYRS